MGLKSLILKCDFLGYKQSFSIGAENTFQTLCGFICSFIISIILTIFGYTLLTKVLKHKNPNIIITTYFDEEIPSVEFDQNTIIMTMALQNPDYSYYINEKIYYIDTFLVTKETVDSNGTIKTSEEQLPISKCSEVEGFKYIPDYFLSLDLHNLYCLNLEKPITLEGEYGRKIFRYLQYRYKRCVNSTLNSNYCSSNPEIDEKLSGGYLGLFISQFSIVPNNYDKPISVA